MPAQGWQTMTDCRPEPGGGLRAAVEPTTWDLTGITNQSTSTVLALIQFGQQGAGGNDVRYIWMKDSSANLIRVWNFNGSAWSQLTTHAYDPTDPGPYVQVDTFRKSSGTDFVLYIIWQNGGNAGVEGLWEINRTSLAVASVDVTFTPTSLCVMDDIVVVANGARLYFSVSGSTALDHTNRFLDVQASRWEALINGTVYIAPSDLLCATNSTVWSRVQGSLATDPLVRSMSDNHNVTGIQNLNLSDAGILFVEQGTGIMATGDGSAFENLSAQIDPTVWPTGDISNQDHMVICPNGYAYDMRTHAWYTLSDISASVYHYNARRDNKIVVATSGTSPTIYSYDPSETSRQETYTAKTAPIRSSDGRRTKIRQVQLICQAFHTGDSFAVTVNGTTKNTGSLTAGKQIVPLLFHEEAEVLDVQVVATANSASNEAPLLEGIRIGKAPAHRSR